MFWRQSLDRHFFTANVALGHNVQLTKFTMTCFVGQFFSSKEAKILDLQSKPHVHNILKWTIVVPVNKS